MRMAASPSHVKPSATPCARAPASKEPERRRRHDAAIVQETRTEDGDIAGGLFPWATPNPLSEPKQASGNATRMGRERVARPRVLDVGLKERAASSHQVIDAPEPVHPASVLAVLRGRLGASSSAADRNAAFAYRRGWRRAAGRRPPPFSVRRRLSTGGSKAVIMSIGEGRSPSFSIASRRWRIASMRVLCASRTASSKAGQSFS